MRKHSTTSGLLLIAGIVALAAIAMPSYALTPPALMLADGLGNVVTIDSSGNPPTLSAGCVCSTTSYSVASGSITWSGTIGAFGVYSLNGRTKPALASPNIDIGSQALFNTGTTSGTLTIQWTDTGFSAGSGPAAVNETFSVPSGTGSAVYTGYVDNTNAAFGTGTTVATVGPTSSNALATGPGPTTVPFSMTAVEAITLGANAIVVNDYALGASLNVPGLTITKSASPSSITLTSGGNLVPVTYTYTVESNVTLTNVVVTDDNGCALSAGIVCTPGAATVTIQTIPTLLANTPYTFKWITYPPLNTVVANTGGPGSSNCSTASTSCVIAGGTLIIQPYPATCLTTGVTPCYLSFTLNQSLGLNDNSYGSNSSAGWLARTSGPTGDHQFSDLTGSDQAYFTFYDAAGIKQLEVDADYISAGSAPLISLGCPDPNFSAYPSGYGTLGDCGGDGQFVYPSTSSTSPYVIGFDTTLTDDLNQSSAFHGYTTNSPPPGFPGWNFVDGYTVIINPAVFGTAGFGYVTIPLIHNSPSINGTDQISETPGCASGAAGTLSSATSTLLSPCVVTNTATVTGMNGSTPLTASATASVTITSAIAPTAGASAGPAPGGPAGPAGPPAPPSPATPPAPPAPPTPPTPPTPLLNLPFPAGPAANGTVGTPYSVTLAATGGVAPYTYSVSVGTLPAGLALNAATGAITGTPTTAVSGPAANITFKVVDSATPTHASATASGAINITAAPAGPPAPPTPAGPPAPPTP